MIYRIILDGENRFEEVYFKECTRENATRARELITEKYVGHELIFADPIEHDIEIFRLANERYLKAEEIMYMFKDIASGSKQYIDVIPKLFEYVSMGVSSHFSQESEHSSWHTQADDITKSWIYDLAFHSHSNRTIVDWTNIILLFIYPTILLYQCGYINGAICQCSIYASSILNYLLLIIQEMEKLKENKDWTSADDCDDNYYITEWR